MICMHPAYTLYKLWLFIWMITVSSEQKSLNLLFVCNTKRTNGLKLNSIWHFKLETVEYH